MGIVRNKSSKNVARVIQDVLLPMCIQKLQRMFSDNGLEFVGRPFQQMGNRTFENDSIYA